MESQGNIVLRFNIAFQSNKCWRYKQWNWAKCWEESVAKFSRKGHRAKQLWSAPDKPKLSPHIMCEMTYERGGTLQAKDASSGALGVTNDALPKQIPWLNLNGPRVRPTLIVQSYSDTQTHITVVMR